MTDCPTPDRIPSTLAAALEASAATDRGVTYVLSSREERRLPYAGLLDRARRWLGRLQDRGVREGDELVLATDDQELFTAVFWACILGRIVAVPVSTPTNDEGAAKILNVLDVLDSPWLLSDQPLEARLAAGHGMPTPGSATLARMAGRIITASDGAAAEGRLAEPAAAAAGDVALIQFSSGSTGTPKGVTLAHANLLANVRAIMDHLGPAGAQGRLLNWMPLTHDFGIIWFHIMPVVFALDHAMIPTKLFIRNPLIWMQKTSDFRASILGGPNYSYRHLLKHLDPADASGEGGGGEGGAARGWDLSCVRVVVNGAEPIACDLIADFQRAMAPYGLAPGAMMPAYGLAEGTLCVCLTPVGAGLRSHAVDRRTVSVGMRVRPDDDPGSLDRIVFADVGVPVATVGLRIADAHGAPCPDETVGAIQISGPSVMRGYRNNPEATGAVLSEDGWLDTGDLGYLRDGRLVVTGRRKDVVILNGVNYYPQDIERVAAEVPGLDLNMVLACAVPLPGEGREGLALCILFRKSPDAFAPLAEQVRDHVVRKIGIAVDHCLMVPRIPKTTSGKVRRFHLVERFAAGAFDEQIAVLRRLAGERGAALREARAAGDRPALLAALAALASRIAPSGTVDPGAPLMEQGLTSLRLVEFLNRVNHALETALPVSVLFDHPTLAGLTGHLMTVPPDGDRPATGPEPVTAPPSAPALAAPGTPGEAVAVVGIGCRFPGEADGPDAFWQRLAAGFDATGPFPAGRWPAALNAGATTDRGAYLDGLDRFDARFFNLAPVEAEALDPQQRLLLTVSWEAFEHAGIDPHGLRGAPVGVFTGISGSDYAQAQARGALDGIGAYAFTGTAPSVASGRLSFFHGFAGPNLAVDTACSSSLAAVHLAVRALRAGDCELALAAGVNLILAPELQVGLSRMNALSPDGRCKSFDAAADGYARGEGCGAVLLKRLDDARRDGDRVLAVIRGSAMNHDGASNGLTAPSGAAQQAVLRAALADSGLEPDGIDYVEAHGTGTALGDPVEVMALAAVHGRDRPTGPLLVGSVKSNIAHLEAAAGIAALCKTVLALERGLLPASLHLRTPNPRIPWATIPVEVVAAARPWPDTPGGRPRRAGVSAFGMSGTNVHVIVEAPPAPAATAVTGDTPPPALIALTARTEADLVALAHRYGDALRGADAARLHDIAHTAALGRAAFPHRLSVAGREAGALADRLAAVAPRDREPASPTPRIVFAFSGQGSQTPGAGRELFESEPVFRDSLLRAERVLGDRLGRPLTELMFAGTAEDLARTAVTQPAVVAFGLALAELLRSWGVVPAAVLGHSVGEIAAAAVAGVCDADTALLMAARRGALMQALPPGAMAAAACDPATAEAALAQAGGVCCVAAVNGPASVTLSGEGAAVERAVAVLRGRGVRTTRLDVSHAFHSPLMDPILAELEGMVRERPLGEPRVPFHSTVTGGRAGAGLLSDPAYWARHARAPVRFHEALQGVPVDAATVFVELGARPGLAPLAAASLPEATWLAVSGGPDPALRLDETLGRLFELGVPLSWPALFATRPGRRATAPTYPFQGRTRLLPTIRTGAAPTAPVPNAMAFNAIVAPAVPMTIIGTSPRRDGIAATIRGILKGIAGLDPAEVAPSASWFSLGLDSLLIVQLQQALGREYAVELALADVLEHGSTLDSLSALVDSRLPPPAHPGPATPASPATAPAVAPVPAPVAGVEGLLSRQIDAMSALFQQQLAVLQGTPAAPPAAATTAPPPAAVAVQPSAAPAPEIKGLFKKLPGKRDGWSEAQAAHVRRLAADHNARTRGSKEHTDRHRDVYANPRAVIGFRPEWKELTYPLHVARAEGAYVWDVDGNRYVDITMGFGVTLLGHNPPFVREAVAAELAAGAPLGPQTARAGTVARLLAEMTGAERVAFFTTGSEAVMVAVRLARAVTGRTKIVLFVNSYHGTFDGVLAVGWADGGRVTSMPVTDGTPQRMVDDVIVLRYGDPAALDVIRAHAGELAAVLVEPVQSRDPAVQPREFLHALRALTTDKDIALVFDEMIMGFRIHPGGAQHHFGVTADLATYGKIVGGGMPVGVVAGKRRFMDAVDGGLWRYGDDSAPSARTAFVAGTFNNHPLSMAAAEAMLRHLKEAGPGLQQALNARTAAMAADLDALFEAEEVPVRVAHFGSLFRFDFAADTEILNHHLLKNGVFVWEGRNCFLSTAHSDADIAFIVEAVRRSVAEMRAGGWLPPRGGGRADADAAGSQTSAIPVPTGGPIPMPVGRGQQEMWFLLQSRPGATLAYNEMVALDLRGPLAVPALQRALDALVARHPALRATALDGDTWRAAPPAPVPLPVHPVADAAAVTAWLAADLGRPFDLKAGPPLRAALLRRDDGRHALALTVHHIVADGWSLGLMVSELSTLYAAERHGRPAALPPAQPFDAFVAWSAALPPQPPALAIEPAPAVLLPREDAHARTPSFQGGRIHRREPAGPSGPLYGRVKALARAQDVSPVMVLLAGFALLLGRLADQRRFTVGLPVAGHGEAGMPNMVGAASAVLPLAVTLDPGEPFAALLQRVKADLTAAQRDIRRLFRREPDGPAPAVNALFNVDRGVRMGFDGLEMEWLSPPVAHPKMDLFLNVLELNGEALFDFDHDSTVAGPATAARWFESFVALLDRAATDPQAPLRSLPLSPADQEAVQAATASGSRTVDGFGVPAAVGVVAPVQRRTDTGWSDSGELGRLRPDGTLELLGTAGRLLRGPCGWIDLGAVETALAEHPAVTRAVVVPEEAGLTAFTDGNVPAGVLAAFLRARLPADHVPTFFAALPTASDNADTDAVALRAGDAERVRGREIVAPRSPEEARVAAVWSSVLGLAELGVTESFFDLGGHSLKALAILARLAREFGRSVPLRRFFEAPTVAGLARLLAGDATAAEPIPRLADAPDHAPSNAQARLWMLEQIDPGLTAYNIGFALVGGPPVDEPALRRALDRLARRHESLRTALVERDGLPRQVVEAEPAPVLTVENVDGEDAARTRALAIAAAPFDLGRAPLWRVALLTGGDGARIVAVLHHAIGDVWSVGIFIRDLLALYGQERGGAPILPLAALPELPVQYRDHAAWQAERQDAHLPFWRQRLDGAPAALELPADRPRPPVKTYDGDQVTVTVPAASAAALRALAAARDASPFMAVTAGLYALLHRATGRGDLLIGGVEAGRDHPALEDAIGFFVNTLPLRTTVAPSDSFLDLLDRTRATMLEAFEHGDTPFDRIVEAVGAPRDPARNPLFEIVLVMDDREGIAGLLDGTGWRAEEIDTATAQFDLTLYVTDRPDGIDVKAAYNTNLFDRARIERLMAGFTALLTAAAATPERPLAELAVAEPASAEPSPHQERLWFVDRFERGVLYPQGPTYYNMPVVARLATAPDPARLEAALARLTARHPALRTAIATEGERPVLRPAANAALPLARIAAPAGNGLEAVEAASREPFDLARAPLARATLCMEEGGTVFLALTAHHAVADKRTLHRLVDELATLCADPGATLPALAEPAAARDGHEAGREADTAFWRSSLDGLTALVLPTDRPRPAIHTYTAGRTALTLDADTTSAAATLARRLGDGAFSVTDVMRAAWLGLLHRLSGQADVVIGEPFEPAGPLSAGPHANPLTLRADLDAAPGFADLLRQSAGRRRAAEAHAAMPFDHVVLAIKPKNDMSRTALFDVLFHHDTGDAPALAAAGGRIVDTGLGWGKYDLVLSLRDAGGGALDATLVYNRDLFDDAGARRILERFRQFAAAAVAAPEAPLAELDLMVEGEREALLARAAQVADYPRHLTIQTAFEAAAARHAERVAVTNGERTLTYAALNAQANRLARALRAHGVGPDRLAGVYLDRTAALPVAFLGILKAGGAYVPMDPDYPAERVRFMVEDSGAEMIVTDAAHAQDAARFGRPVLLVDQAEGSEDNPIPTAGPENLAYVIFTSGSTGLPKGVMVEHRNLVQLMFHDRHPFAFGPADVWTLFHSPCFDFSVWEMYGALLHGGRLVVVPRRVAQDGAAFLDCLSREGVTVLNQTPTAFHALIDAALARPDTALSLREVIFGGEALQPARLADWHRRHPDTRLVNMYGITETTVHVTFKVIGAAEIAAGRSVIGAPLPSYGVLLVDSALRPLPVGVVGEILVAGHGVARGYLDRPELTAERFIAHPALPGRRLYRSGDLGRMTEDGELVYLGRLDHQVKIRGFRIELGEIERQLLAHAGIRDAVVLPDGDSLSAYLATEPGTILLREDIVHHVSDKLPDYMVPSRFLRVDAIPLTANGKIDRAALAAGGRALTGGDGGGTADEPQTPVQQTVAAIWREVLGIGRVGLRDNFFELGGHSLKANQAVVRIRRQLDRPLTLKDFFSAQTLGALADLLTTRGVQEDGTGEDRRIAPAPPPADPADGHPLSFAQRRLCLLQSMEPDSVSYNMVGGFVLDGPLRLDALAHAFEGLVIRHEVLRTRFVTRHGQPRQLIDPPSGGFILETEDRRRDHAADTGAVIEEALDAELRHVFDLGTGPLLRVRVVDLPGGDSHALLLNMHHVVSDGWSVTVMLRELEALYRAALAAPGRTGAALAATLPPLPLQYRDYAAWQVAEAAGPGLAAARRFWLGLFEDRVPVLALPTDRPRPEKAGGGGAIVNAPLDRPLTAALNALARAHGTTLFVVLAALVRTQLHLVSGDGDIVLGTPVAGRTQVELEGLIGFHLNLLPLRLRLPPGQSFAGLLAAERALALDAFTHQSYPFDRLVEELDPPRLPGRQPLFDALVILQNNEPLRLDLPDMTARPIRDVSVSAKYDLNYMFEDRPEIELALEYAADLFDPDTAARLAAEFVALARRAVADPGAALAALDGRDGTATPHEASPAAPALPDGSGDDELMDAW